MPRFRLDNVVILAALAVVFLLVAMLVRGGGYGIGGITWDANLVITRANLMLADQTILPGDRIQSITTYPVHRDADLRGVLRSLDHDEIWLEVVRDHYEVAVPLTPEVLDAGDIPAVLEGPYQVVAIDDQRVFGDMNLADMGAWMQMNGGLPSVFTVDVPDHPFVGPALRVERPGPILPIVLLLFTLAVVALAYFRARSEMMAKARQHWHLLGISLALGGILLAFLTWHDGFLADPVLLPAGLVGLCLWRPLSLAFHQQRLGVFSGPSARYFRWAVALPVGILLPTALYGYLRSLPQLSGQALDGFVFDQLRLLVLISAAVVVLYHLVDIALHATFLRGQPASEWLRQSPPWIAALLSVTFLLTACLDLANQSGSFVVGGYAPHLAGMVALQWLGDMALLPRRGGVMEWRAASGERWALTEHLRRAKADLGLTNPALVCRFPAAGVVLQPSEDVDEAGAPERLTPHPADEKLMGLLDLLEAEGGMFPRVKSYHGSDPIDDPFDGLERTTAVEFALPIQAPLARSSGVKVYLVSRSDPERESGFLAPAAEALETWQRDLTRHAENWTDLLALATHEALAILSRQAPAEPGEVATANKATVLRSDPDADRRRALLHYLETESAESYPIGEAELLTDDELQLLEGCAQQHTPLLIQGEPGSGRTFAARKIHGLTRRAGAFVTLDCSVIPEALVATELEGDADTPGRLTAARQGTLCIRELSILSEGSQAEILERVRAASEVRLILVERSTGEPSSALSAPILRMVDEAIITVEPLRRRPQVLESAADFYVHRFAMSLGLVLTEISPGAVAWLLGRPWPANFYSLTTLLREALPRCEGETLSATMLETAHASLIAHLPHAHAHGLTVTPATGQVPKRPVEQARASAQPGRPAEQALPSEERPARRQPPSLPKPAQPPAAVEPPGPAVPATPAAEEAAPTAVMEVVAEQATPSSSDVAIHDSASAVNTPSNEVASEEKPHREPTPPEPLEPAARQPSADVQAVTANEAAAEPEMAATAQTSSEAETASPDPDGAQPAEGNLPMDGWSDAYEAVTAKDGADGNDRRAALAKTLEDVERQALLEALADAKGNKSVAARALGMKRTTFIRKLAKYAPEL